MDFQQTFICMQSLICIDYLFIFYTVQQMLSYICVIYPNSGLRYHSQFPIPFQRLE